jgi:DNA-binding beta-propeller fold protein YncE
MRLTRHALVVLIGLVTVFMPVSVPGFYDQDSRPGSVWVVNRDLGELAVFDARSGTVLKRVPVGAGAHDICISEKAHKAYITAETINVVTAVDISSLDIGTSTFISDSIPVSPLPHHCEPSRDERTIYVSLASHPMAPNPAIPPQYAAIDIDDNSVTYTTTSSSPAARSHGVNPSFDGLKIYVTHDTGNQLTGIDAETGNVDFTIAPILRAEESVGTRSGQELWVSSRGDRTVKRIDLETNTITDSIEVGDQPESVLLTPNERTLVVSLRGMPATLGFVDTVKRELIGTVQIAGAGTAGDLAVMTNDGQYVYATFSAGANGTGGVAVVRVKTREVVDTWAYPATGRPHGIAYSRKKLH